MSNLDTAGAVLFIVIVFGSLIKFIRQGYVAYAIFAFLFVGFLLWFAINLKYWGAGEKRIANPLKVMFAWMIAPFNNKVLNWVHKPMIKWGNKE